MDMAEHKSATAGAEAVPGEPENDGAGAVVSLGDGWDNDDEAGRRPEDEGGRGVVVAFGQIMKTLRVREGLEREEFGKEQVKRAQYPGFFQGMAALEKEAIELLSYSTLVFNGLVQTEEYMRAVLGMRCPILDEETIEQRVAARLARQEISTAGPHRSSAS